MEVIKEYRLAPPNVDDRRCSTMCEAKGLKHGFGLGVLICKLGLNIMDHNEVVAGPNCPAIDGPVTVQLIVKE